LSDEPAVRAHDLRVRRGGLEVLGGLTFELPRGCVVGLLGPSGSGKTTLMRALVGVQRHVTGELVVLGCPAGSPALRRRVAYLTQAPSIYGDLTVDENLRYLAAVLGAPAAQVPAVLATVELTGFADRSVRSLSGGQRTRASLASALLGGPELLVLDEPTVGLDPLLRRRLWALFARLAVAGATLLVSSHVMGEARHCDELLLLRDGVLVARETPEGLERRGASDDLDEAFARVIEQAGDRPTGTS
jgi:ABC-2 type transport system ATP-binding protein